MGEMTGINPPCMDWASKDLPTEFRNFQYYCELIFSGPLNKKSDQEKCTYILLWLGQEGIRIHKSWGKDFKTPAEVFEAFIKHFEPKTNFRLARFQLQKLAQEPAEAIDDFMARCKIQAQKCKFADIELEGRLIEQIVIGTSSKKVQQTLLAKDEKLTLNTALDIARTQEATEADMKLLHGQAVNVDMTKQHIQRKKQCSFCGLNHPPRKCPAYGTKCRNCDKMNHWEKCCRLKKQEQESKQQWQRKQEAAKTYPKRSQAQRSKRLHEMKEEEETEETVDMRFETICVDQIRKNEAFAVIGVEIGRGPATLKAKVDTGSEGNILPLRIYQKMYPDRVDSNGEPITGKLRKSPITITGYGEKSVIPQVGLHTLSCNHQDRQANGEFFVVKTQRPAILGLELCLDLGLVVLNCSLMESHDSPIKDREHLKTLYPDRFDGIGKFDGKYHIVIDKDAAPVIHAVRRCPIGIKDDIKKELDEMESLEVIESVTKPTDWVSSLAYTQKPNGRWRICLDPKDLNKAIKRSHMPMPTIEEVRHQFEGATVFSTLDARHGYWAIQLDEESSYLTTFNSPFGRYRFKRLPFGLCVSQDVFQQRMNQILEKCPGVIGMADDIAVVGKTAVEHDANLHNLMRVAKEHGLVLNWNKCHIKQDRVRFYGLVFSKDGVQPDPQKTAAISALNAPQNVTELREFLGIVTYMSPFIPRLASLTAPLRELVKKDVIYSWTESHQKVFETIKDMICKETTLAYFDPKKPVVLEVDASMKGVGAALTQEGRPIAFASKSLTDTEQRYANIEREMLAVVYACEKFHTFVFGRSFTILSDHKPLEMITLKNLGAAPPRLQRLLLRLQGYDMTVKYKPGKEMLLSDAMSRLNPLPPESPEMHMKVDFVMFSDKKLLEIRTATSEDCELCILRDVILEGWPEERRKLDKSLIKYWPYRDEMSIEDGIILKGSRIVIPKCLTKEYLNKLHEGHQGIIKCQLRAKSCIFWNGINQEIEMMVRKCSVCQEYGNSLPSETLQPHEIPVRPWQFVTTDLFTLDGREYLLVADVYSKYPIVKQLPQQATSSAVIRLLKEIFSEQGTPERLMSDNGPQYNSAIFVEFARDWNFQHVTSSPRYPQSNGFIERQVQTVKNTMKKAKRDNIGVNKALQCLRATPLDSHLPSPAELLLGRKIQTNIPTRIRNQSPQKDDIYQRLQTRQDDQKKYFDDKHATNLPPLHKGQEVRIQNQETGRWDRGKITNRRPEPRSYEVETSSGYTLRRNRRHIKPTQERDSMKQNHQHASDRHNDVHDQQNAQTEQTLSKPDTPSNHHQPYTTRSGRTIKKPERYDM
eukprot:XP_011662467.1 PREDICTED: uncharacterized protein K02A2.6-like [Strongylocentrotus purpuratus]